MRKITVDGDEYEWKVGKKHVEIRGPNNFKKTPLIHQASNGFYSAKDVEDPKGNWTISPAMIALYIMTCLNEVKKKK